MVIELFSIHLDVRWWIRLKLNKTCISEDFTMWKTKKRLCLFYQKSLYKYEHYSFRVFPFLKMHVSFVTFHLALKKDSLSGYQNIYVCYIYDVNLF